MDADQTETMKKIYNGYDPTKKGFIDNSKIVEILQMMGSNFDDEELQEKIEEVDKEKAGKVNFKQFIVIVTPFLEDEDEDALEQELKEAFRMYDTKGEGFITTQVLKDIMAQLDPKLTDDDLQQIVDEVDEDGSGTVDFDEFMEMMTG